MIELNRSRNNVVLSRRAVLEEERKEQRQQILDKLQPGDVVEGQISNIVDFGAFVDLDGMDGLIHISELSWSHVNHPSEVLEIGQTVQVKVLDIDRDRQRISLGLKQTQNDPWQQVIESYHESDVVEGRVTKVVTFGAFVEILPGVEGLVHISELAQHHVENPREVVSQGQPVNVKIIEVDGERRRLSLSLKRVEDDDPVQPRADGAESVHTRPTIDLSEDVFADEAPPSKWSRQPAAAPEEDAEAPDAPDELPAAEAEARAADGRGRRDRGRRRAGARSSPPASRKPSSPRSDQARSPSRSPAASEPGRARRCRRSRGTAPPRSRATRSSTTCCGARRSATRSSSGWGTASSRPTGEIDRGALATVVFNDRDALAWLEELLHPLVSLEYLRVARAARRAAGRAGGLRDRGAAPLRDRRGRPLRQGRRDHGAGRSFGARARSSRPRSARRACSPTTRRSQRADYAYENIGSLEELDAFVASVMDELDRREAPGLAARRRGRRWSAPSPT